MKHFSIILSLVCLCLPFSVSAMEYTDDGNINLEPTYLTKTQMTTTRPSFETVVNSIDIAINKKHGTNNVITNTLTPFFLSEEKILDIIDTIEQCYPDLIPNDSLLNALYKKNDYLKRSVDYFTDIASQNINEATCLTLQTIEQPQLQQPKIQLNQFAAPLKRYFMTKALNKIEHSYDIKLAGHTDDIQCFDISSTAHLAATGAKDKKLRIWNLKTGAQTHTLENEDTQIIHFNPNGSRIAASAKRLSDKTNVLKEWCPQSGELYWTIETEKTIVNFDYAKNTTRNILSVLTGKKDPSYCNQRTQTILSLKGKTPYSMGTTSVKDGFYQSVHQYESKDQGDYFAHHPSQQIMDNTTLYVTKIIAAHYIFVNKQ